MKDTPAASPLKGRRRFLVPAPLTLAVAAGLSLAGMQPAFAGDVARQDVRATIARVFGVAEERQAPDPSQSSLASLPAAMPEHRSGVAGAASAAPSSAQPAASATPVGAAAQNTYQEPGETGDPDSWVTDEFKANWGLGAIGAQYAYARGLSGNGIGLGITDTGTFAGHPEFAGSGRLHPILSSVEFGDSAPWEADGGVGRPVFGDHGTHTSGTVAASRDGSGMHGVAFGIDLFAASGYALDKTAELVGEGTEENPGILGDINKFLDDWNKDPDLPPNERLPFLTSEEVLALMPDEWRTPAFDARLVADGFDKMAEQGVRAINNSWGQTADLGDTFEKIARAYEESRESDQPMYDAALRAMRDHDVLFVWAAGNSSGEDENQGTLTHADVQPTAPAFIPELESHWVSVVSLTEDLERSDFSSICGETRNWCIAAPGSRITSTGFDLHDSNERLNAVARLLAEAKRRNIDGETVAVVLENVRQVLVDESTPEELNDLQDIFEPVGIDITQPHALDTALADTLGVAQEPWYKDDSGTSMAAPHVTGALGLLFERFPYLTATQVRNVMFTTATDLGAAGVDEIFGWGLLNLERAIEGPGMLLEDTVVDMNQAAGGAKVWEGDAWDDWSNDISGPGRLFKDGAGWLRLSGNNSFAGASVREGTLEFDGDNTLTGTVEVVSGNFILNGSLQGSELRVFDDGHAVIEGTVSGSGTWVGGWLGGNGTLGDATIAGTIAPGDAFEPGIGTLSFTGDYTQQAGSYYAVDLFAAGASDRIDVSGSATLEGGTVIPLRLQGSQYAPGQSYRILSATGGVSGAFAGLDTTSWDMPFLAFDLGYSPFAVNLDVTRGASFASVAGTWNQMSTGAALDNLTDASPLLLPMLQLNEDRALAAFDQLSGELYPSLRSALVESGRMPRQAVMQRARIDADGFATQANEGRHHGLWADIQRSGGHVAADGNARRIDHNSHAVLAGYDHRFEAGWRLGAMLGSGRTDFDLSERSHKGHADTRYAGLYGGGNWGGFGLRAGVLYARHKIDAERRIVFPDFDDQTYASFDGHTRQAVIEAGYLFDHRTWELEPFLQYANIRVKHDAIDEVGDGAALHAPGTSSRVNLGTVGVRFSANLKGSRQEASWLSLRGMLGYRRASGDRTPATDLAFAGGDDFNVRGAPIADGSVLVEAGFAARLTTNTLLELGYSGQLADEARDHGANARISVRF